MRLLSYFCVLLQCIFLQIQYVPQHFVWQSIAIFHLASKILRIQDQHACWIYYGFINGELQLFNQP